MYLVGAQGQRVAHPMYDASGTITAGGTAQLVLPKARSRSAFLFQNTSTATMYLEFDGARATATLTNGTVTSCAITNAGFGFTSPPLITFLGGGFDNPNKIAPTFTIAGLPDYPAPSNFAQAHCVMGGAAPNQTVSSIVIDNPGAKYSYPPYVLLTNDPSDPYGCAIPSTGVGILMPSGGLYSVNGTSCGTGSVSVYCGTTSATYACKYMP